MELLVVCMSLKENILKEKQVVTQHFLLEPLLGLGTEIVCNQFMFVAAV